MEQELTNLERCQSLEKVHRLHESGDHRGVVDLLLATFRESRSQLVEVVERREQLLLLQDSLLQLRDHVACLRWSEVSFHEAAKRCYHAGNRKLMQEWTRTMASLLTGIDT